MAEEYINGSDILVSIDGKASGHCTSHTATFSTETKDVAVKPVATEAKSAKSLFKKKRITGKSVQVKSDGLSVYDESEAGIPAFLKAWHAGTPVTLNLFHRGNDAKPYATGQFIISNLEETAPAGDDVTYSVTFDNDGPVDIDAAEYKEAVAGSAGA